MDQQWILSFSVPKKNQTPLPRGVDRPTPSVASTADSEKTGGRSEEKARLAPGDY